jgi:mycothione reductase
MKQYDLIIVGSGSAMNIVDLMIERNPKIKIAVIDKDEPGGICLTRGCIPSKIMVYPAELVRTLDGAEVLGLDVEVKGVSYDKIMRRMRSLIDKDIESIRERLSNSENIDYYHAQAEFIAPYQISVEEETIVGNMIFLGTGSRAVIPEIKGLDSVGYQTSDSIIRMEMKNLPGSIAIVGAGYIGAEFGHFFAALGSKVTIIGRNPQFLPGEEPEISVLAARDMGKHMGIMTNCEAPEVRLLDNGIKTLEVFDRRTSKTVSVEAEEILVAAGRGPTNDILRPEEGGVRTTKEGWIEVNEFLETSQPNVWALGDSHGKYLFRHVANYESEVLYENAVLKRKVQLDYHTPCRVHLSRGRQRGIEGEGGCGEVRGKRSSHWLSQVRGHGKGRGDGRQGLLREGLAQEGFADNTWRAHHRSARLNPDSGNHQSDVHRRQELSAYAGRDSHPSVAERGGPVGFRLSDESTRVSSRT